MYHNSALQGSSGCRKKALAKTNYHLVPAFGEGLQKMYTSCKKVCLGQPGNADFGLEGFSLFFIEFMRRKNGGYHAFLTVTRMVNARMRYGVFVNTLAISNSSQLWVWQFYRLLKVVCTFDIYFTSVHFIVTCDIKHIKFRSAETEV